MASLRQGYEEWMLNEPEDPQSDRPTDAEMEAFADAEKKHEEEVSALGNCSSSTTYRRWVSHFAFSSRPNSSSCWSSKLLVSQAHSVSAN